MPNENSMLAFTMSREDALSFPKVTGAVAALKEDLEEVYGRRDIMNVGCTLQVSGKPPIYTDYPETMNSSESIPTKLKTSFSSSYSNNSNFPSLLCSGYTYIFPSFRKIAGKL